MMMDLWLAAMVYCALVAGTFTGLWLWYDRRDRRVFDAEGRRVTFHCVRCGALYAAPPQPEVQACSRCGHPNSRLRF